MNVANCHGQNVGGWPGVGARVNNLNTYKNMDRGTLDSSYYNVHHPWRLLGADK